MAAPGHLPEGAVLGDVQLWYVGPTSSGNVNLLREQHARGSNVCPRNP